jgi:hypothetical protein
MFKIRIDLTIGIRPEDLPALRELAGGVDTNPEARDFVKGDIIEYLESYLGGNGVQVTVLREG